MDDRVLAFVQLAEDGDWAAAHRLASFADAYGLFREYTAALTRVVCSDAEMKDMKEELVRWYLIDADPKQRARAFLEIVDAAP